MPRPKGPHLQKPGATRWLAGEKVSATYCGTWLERDDCNIHGIANVKCALCLKKYRAEKEKQA